MTETKRKPKIKVLGNKVAIEKVAHEKGKTASGIIIPENAQTPYENGKIIAVGKDSELKVGDKVIINPSSGAEVRITTLEPTVEFVVMRDIDVICVVDN